MYTLCPFAAVLVVSGIFRNYSQTLSDCVQLDPFGLTDL